MIVQVKERLNALLSAAGCGARVFDEPEMDRLNAALPLAVIHTGPEKTAPAAGLYRQQNPDGTWSLYRKKLERNIPLLVHIFARSQAEMETVASAFLLNFPCRMADENGAPVAVNATGVERNIPQKIVNSAVMAEVAILASGHLCQKTVIGKIPVINIPAFQKQTTF